MELDIIATYTHGTQRFWCYEAMGKEGIFKFWIPHTERRDDGTYRSLPPPKTIDMHVKFRREDNT